MITTAATNIFDQKASFSNYGSAIVVDAPGVNVILPYPAGMYSVVSGTSFSAPTVAATAALVRSLHVNGTTESITGAAFNIDSRITRLRRPARPRTYRSPAIRHARIKQH